MAKVAGVKKAAFLKAYAQLGTVVAASQATGIPWRTHYDWLHRSPQYAEAFKRADEQATEVLEGEARRRAFHGVEETVYYGGQACGTTRRYSDILLIFLLKGRKPEMYRDRYEATLKGGLANSTVVTVVHEMHEGPAALPPPSSFTPQLPPAPGEDDPPFE